MSIIQNIVFDIIASNHLSSMALQRGRHDLCDAMVLARCLPIFQLQLYSEARQIIWSSSLQLIATCRSSTTCSLELTYIDSTSLTLDYIHVLVVGNDQLASWQ